MSVLRERWQDRPVEHVLPPADEFEHDVTGDHWPNVCPDPYDPGWFVNGASRGICLHGCPCGPSWTSGGKPHHWIVTHHEVLTVPTWGTEAGPGSYG